MPVIEEKPVRQRKYRRKRSRSNTQKLLEALRSVHSTTWLFLSVALFFALVRFHQRDLPLERDEGEYAYSGQLMLQGMPFYQLAYNMKLPGTYGAYALLMAMFGESPSGIHTGLLFINALTTLLIFVLARKLFGSICGAFAGMSYAALSASPAVFGLAGHATHFVALAAVVGLLFLVYALESDSVTLFFYSGTCLGLAFLMKQPGILFAAFALAYSAYQKRGRYGDWPYAASRGGALIAGVAWPFALTCLLLYADGVFPKFWFWTVTYARTYASVPFAQAVREIGTSVALLARTDGPLLAIAVLGLVALLWFNFSKANTEFAVGLLVFSFLAVSVGLHFRNHYFIMLLPAAALLSGVAIDAAAQFLREHGLGAAALTIPAIAFGIALVVSVAKERQLLFAPNPVVASHRMYPNNPFVEAQEIGEFLKRTTPSTARVAVLGSEPEIYFVSQRHSATGYIYTYSLMEDQKYAAQMQQEMIKEITNARPEYVVYVDNQLSWLWQPGGSRELFFKWIQLYVNGQYKKTAQVDIPGFAEHLLENTSRIYVFRRNAP